MSHKTVIMGIPSHYLNGSFDTDTVSNYVEKVMAQYVEETAREENIKCDWYVIGGRWAGCFGALKSANHIWISEQGVFAYQLFDEYDAIANGGKRGPYVIEDVEYVPINGGLKKDIAWDSIHKFDVYTKYLLLEMIQQQDPRLGQLPDEYKFKADGLYVESEGELYLLLKAGESFEEYVRREEIIFANAGLDVDAYIDISGMWHDESDCWDNWIQQMANGKSRELPENPGETAKEEFDAAYHRFVDNELSENDGIIVLDCHCFP